MTWQFTPNVFIPTAGGDVGRLWTELKDLGVLHGSLVVMGSGDGLAAFQNTGDTAGPYDVLTGGALGPYGTGGANSYSNRHAWIRLREAGSTREWIIQRSTTNTLGTAEDYRIQMSVTGYDDVAVASATVAPTASAGDSHFLVGTLTLGDVWGPSWQADCRVHIAIQDAATNGVYPWFIFSRDLGPQTTNGFGMYEAMEEPVVGDPQPWVMFMPRATGPVFSSTDSQIHYYIDHGGGTEQYLDGKANLGGSLLGLFDGANIRHAPGVMPAQTDGNSRAWPVPVASDLQANYKGICSFIKWKGTAGRNYPSTANLATADAKIYVDDMLLPWPTNVLPI